MIFVGDCPKECLTIEKSRYGVGQRKLVLCVDTKTDRRILAHELSAIATVRPTGSSHLEPAPT
jgi:hypothetical protein